MTKQRAFYLALASGLTLCGCLAPQTFSRFMVAGEPSVMGIVPTQARMLVSVTRAVSARAAQNVGGLTFDGADLSLANATLLTGPSTKSITLAASATSSAGVFSALRPGAGYSLDVTLKNGVTPVGVSHAASISLPAGLTTPVTVVVGANGEIEVATSSVGNAVGSSGAWTLAKGDTVILKTGFAASESGVAKLQVSLSDSLYGSESIIAETGSNFDRFSWTTGADATNGGYSYTAANLTTTGSQNGTITFTLLDGGGKVVGRTRLTGVSVEAGASMDLKLQ